MFLILEIQSLHGREGEDVGAGARACKWGNDRRMRLGCDAGGQPELPGAGGIRASIEQLWPEVELSREQSWQENPAGVFDGLRRRAFLVARSLPILPGRSVLEFGAGSGVWTEHLAAALAGHNRITAAVFSGALMSKAKSRKLSNTRFIYARDFQEAFARGSFDYVVGTDIVTDSLCAVMLELAYRWLKPGGRLLLFVENAASPLAILQKFSRFVTRRGQVRRVRQSVALKGWAAAAMRQGFSEVELAPYEVISPRKSAVGQAMGLILERAPGFRRFSRVVAIQATKPAAVSKERVPEPSLATHRQLFGQVSVVVPCHNEEANVIPLVKSMLGMYGDYICEIVIVDDNSTDGTARVVATLASTEPRVKLVKRHPPGGVGCALLDGYAAASGKYILTMDCDFITIAPEFRGLFDAVADGYDGAIGSRFSTESALVHYPFLKILCNRGYHLVLNLLLGKQVRDISNNLKLYRAEILKDLDIEADGFAANVETGLKPLLMNYRIKEVPTSWINRTPGMGKSSFSLLKVGPGYLGVLLRTMWKYFRGYYHTSN